MKMIWFERANPDNRGEGLAIDDPEEAEDICRYHNWAYPKYRHKTTEETNTTEQ